MTRYVLDASAGVEFLLDTTRGRSLAARLALDGEWWVPEHYYVEVASVLRRAALNGVIAASRAESAISDLSGAALRRVQVRPLLRDAWKRRASLSLADALYVVLAEHIGATLVTADLRLAASHGLTVPAITP